MKTLYLFSTLLFLSISSAVFGQDEVLHPDDFRATRVIYGQSNHYYEPGELVLVIQHNFGSLNSGFYDLFGLDQASTRLGFDFVPLEWLQLGIGRSVFQKTWDFSAKARLLRQSKGAKNYPISLSYYANMTINGLKWAEPDRDNLTSSRFSYVHQLLISRSFADRISLLLTPTLIHKNLVETREDNNTTYGLGMAAVAHISKDIAVNFEYWYYPTDQTTEDISNTLSVGFDFLTRGHVFQLRLSNAQPMIERAIISENTGKWADGDIYFGFTIIRTFDLWENY